MDTRTITAPAPEAADHDPAARAREDAIRRLTEENALRIRTGELTTRDVVAAVECSGNELHRAGAPAACLPELLERLARVRLSDMADAHRLAGPPTTPRPGCEPSRRPFSGDSTDHGIPAVHRIPGCGAS